VLDDRISSVDMIGYGCCNLACKASVCIRVSQHDLLRSACSLLYTMFEYKYISREAG